MSDPYPIPARKPARPDPWPDSPITLTFRDEIARRESLRDGYRAFNPNTGGGPGAFGRYQLLQRALQDAGMMDAAGAWTGKYSIYSAEDFLDDPIAQEKAFTDYMRRNQEYLSYPSRGYTNIGQRVTSSDGDFILTEGGLMAAAHGEGWRSVRDYLDHLADHGWVSEVASFPSERDATFRKIEERLRDLQAVDYMRDERPLPPRPPR